MGHADVGASRHADCRREVVGGGRRSAQLRPAGTGRTVAGLRRRHRGGRRADRGRAARAPCRTCVAELPAAFWVMAVLAVVCRRPAVRRRRGVGRPSAVLPSICFTFAILLGWGLGPAVAVQALAVIVSGWRMRHAALADRLQRRASTRAPSRAASAVIRSARARIFAGGRPHWNDVAAVTGAAAGLDRRQLRARSAGRSGCVSATGGGPACAAAPGFELLATAALLLLAPVLLAAARVSARWCRWCCCRCSPCTGWPGWPASRAPAAARRADRAAQPQGAAGRGGRAGAPARRAGRPRRTATAAGAAAARPGPVQERQRRARARGGRPAAGRGQRTGSPTCGPRPRIVARLGGDEFAVAGDRADRRRSGPAVGRPGGRRRWPSRSPLDGLPWTSAPRSASPCSPSTARTSPPCCARPRWRCTTPSTAATRSRSTPRRPTTTPPSGSACSPTCAGCWKPARSEVGATGGPVRRGGRRTPCRDGGGARRRRRGAARRRPGLGRAAGGVGAGGRHGTAERDRWWAAPSAHRRRAGARR